MSDFDNMEDMSYNPELGPDGEDKPFLAITQLTSMRNKGYIPVSYVGYREKVDQFPQSFYMAWAMAGTYHALKLVKPPLAAYEMLADIRLCPREDSPITEVPDYIIMGALLLECDRARNFFYQMCEGLDIQTAADNAYGEKHMPGLNTMVPFPIDQASAHEWCPFLGKSGVKNKPKEMIVNVANFTLENMVIPAHELRGILDEYMKLSFLDPKVTLIETVDASNCKPMTYKESGPGPSMVYKESPVSNTKPPARSPVVKNRVYSSKDMQKVFVPQPIPRAPNRLLDWMLRVKRSEQASSWGLNMYSEEHIGDFYDSLLVNGEIPEWANDPSVAEFISKLNDYTIWRIKDTGLFDREKMGEVHYVDASYVKGAIETLHKKAERESRSIFNIENMLKSMINHQKSGSVKFQMSDVPTVAPVEKPLYDDGKPTPEPPRFRHIPPPP